MGRKKGDSLWNDGSRGERKALGKRRAYWGGINRETTGNKDSTADEATYAESIHRPSWSYKVAIQSPGRDRTGGVVWGHLGCFHKSILTQEYASWNLMPTCSYIFICFLLMKKWHTTQIFCYIGQPGKSQAFNNRRLYMACSPQQGLLP